MKKRHLLLSIGLLTLPLQGCDILNSLNSADDKKAFYQSKEQGEGKSSDSVDNLLKEENSNSKNKETNKDKTTIFKAEWLSTTDGDTIKIKSKERGTEKVRLLLVDTPEGGKIGGEHQLYYLNATRFTKSLMKENTYINVEIGEEEYDSYNRLLAYVYLEDGTMLNELLVRNGYARVGYIINDTTHLERLKNAQIKAKNDGLRIWSVDGYVTDDGFNMDVVTDKDIMKSVGD